uniref:Uncharacterized protein n=1 Tax=Anguilla anguilla TaxID=7936 RepID=A0A0E9RV16_ANGAN
MSTTGMARWINQSLLQLEQN